MTLTVGFDATPAARQGAGIGRYTRQLLQAFAGHDDLRFHVYYCGAGTLEGDMPRLGSGFRVRRLPVSDRAMNILWQRARLPLPVQLLAGKFDVFHSPDFTLPPTMHRPSVLTIHDLAFLVRPDCAFPTLRTYLERVVPRSAQRASHIIAVSESTRQDILRLLDVAPERVTTVPEGVDPAFRPLDPDTAWLRVRRLGIQEFFILSVGTLEPRKNYVRLLEAYALLRKQGLSQQLVIAGGKGWLYEPFFRKRRELGLEPYVTIVRPDDEALVALYSAADVFVYPSLYEGFGIPPLEALACGAPVACSQTSSLPEVVGDAALTFDPEDVEQIAAAVARILLDDSLRADLRQRATARARAFSWARAAAQTIDVYRSLAAYA